MNEELDIEAIKARLIEATSGRTDMSDIKNILAAFDDIRSVIKAYEDAQEEVQELREALGIEK